MPDKRNGAVGHEAGQTAYFDRPPERLVLEGYRHWTRGTVLRSTEPWTQAQLLYRALLGNKDGETAIVALAHFVTTLGRCAICPLRVFNAGSCNICRDETLVMGLIAGIQNGDDPAIDLCLRKLCRRPLCDNAAMAAGTFALTLKFLGQTMLPIPAHVVARILDRARHGEESGAEEREAEDIWAEDGAAGHPTIH